LFLIRKDRRVKYRVPRTPGHHEILDPFGREATRAVAEIDVGLVSDIGRAHQRADHEIVVAVAVEIAHGKPLRAAAPEFCRRGERAVASFYLVVTGK